MHLMRIKNLIKKNPFLHSLPSATFGNRFRFSHVVGQPYTKPIDSSTSVLLRQMTEKYPSSMAVHSFDQGISLTYCQVLQKAEELATGLIKTFQLKPKDRIGIYAYNKWEWFIVQMAAAIADLILVNINPAYQSEELGYTIDKVGLSVLFINDKFKNLNYLKIVGSLLPELELNNPADLRSKKFSTLKAVVRMNPDDTRMKGFLNLRDLFQPINHNLFNYNIGKDEPVNIQFTSGTTGRPKAATLSHYNTLNNAYLIGQKCRYTSSDNIAIPVPFYHCFGMIMGSLAAIVRGASSTIICEGFDPKKTLQAVSRYECTSLYGVPTMFIEYIRHYQQNPSLYKISSLRTGIVAGALCSQTLMNKIITVLGLKDMTNCYGMTETSPVSFQTCPTDPLHRKTTTVGKILPGLEAKIINSQGQKCKAGEPGQFWVRGWSVMLKYWEDEKATKQSIEDGWMKSGDLGVIDEEGYLSIVGRIKDMIIRGGENIYPKQIEEFLVKMDGVLDAQVVGVSDQKFGQQSVAVIKVRDLNNCSLDRKQIFDYCKQKIAFYKIPKYVKFVTEYPLTVSGKVQKFIIKNELEEERKSGQLELYKIK